MFPFYCILAAMGLTLFVGAWRYYNDVEIDKEKEED